MRRIHELLQWRRRKGLCKSDNSNGHRGTVGRVLTTLIEILSASLSPLHHTMLSHLYATYRLILRVLRVFQEILKDFYLQELWLILQPHLLQIPLSPANLTNDYCNSLYSGISQSNLNKLQRIQNSLARVITNTSEYQHITPTLKKPHWLPIKQRIDYKVCLVTYKILKNQQPTYLYNSLSFPSHSVSTRSSDSLVLSIPYVRSSLGKRAFFSVIRPRLWNSLPPDTRNSNSLPTFRSRLKTHLFKIAFPP